MKKILILIIASLLLVGCEKHKIMNDLVGYWKYEGEFENNLVLDGIIFEKEGMVCTALSGNSDGTLSLTTVNGEWGLKKDSLILDWGENKLYPTSGEFQIYFDGNDIVYINDYKFIRAEDLVQ